MWKSKLNTFVAFFTVIKKLSFCSSINRHYQQTQIPFYHFRVNLIPLFCRKPRNLIQKYIISLKYLEEGTCFRDKFPQIFAKFAKLNPREKSTGSQFIKLNPREKKFFFSFFRISKTYIFTLGSLSINDGHVKNILNIFSGYQII